MQNKIIKRFFLIGLLLVVSYVISFLIYNFNVLRIANSERKIIEIPISSIGDSRYNSKTTANKKIKIKYHGYIKKLVIEYNSKNTFSYDINYSGRNYYNDIIKKKLNDSLNDKINKSVTMINDEVNNVTIDFSNGNNFFIKKIYIDNSIGFNIYLFTFILFSLFILFIIMSYYKFDLFHKKIERLFFTLVLLIGGLFIILQPYLTSYSYDDQIHFNSIYRMFELDGVTEWTDGYHIYTEVDPFSIGIDTAEERTEQNKFLNKQNAIELKEQTSPLITYGQIGYIVPGITIKICKILGLCTTLTIIITKFSMLIFYALIMSYSIKIIPRGKRILSVFGLMPSMMFLSTQFSYDPPIIAGMCLFTAQFIRLIETKNTKVDLKTSLILLFSIIVASFIKVVYAPLILMLLLIPKEKFSSESQRNIFKIGTILIFILIISTYIFPAASSVNDLADLRGGNTSVSGQIKNIVKYPIGFVHLIKDTAGNLFFNKLVGESTLYNYAYIANNKMVSNNENIYYMLLIIFIYVIITDSYKRNNYKREKIIKIFNFILNFGMIFLVWLALYVSFTPVASTNIFGVQNRYFLPIMMPLILISYSTDKIKINYDLKKYDAIIMFLMTIILLVSLYSVFYLSFCI